MVDTSTFALRRVAVTGATGCIGREVVRQCRRQKIEVAALVRDAKRAATIDGFDGVEFIEGDLSNEDAVRKLVSGADAVIHAAAQVHSVPRSDAEKRAFYEVNREGTRRLVEAARASRCGAFVFLSTVGVYGRGVTTTLSEETPLAPETDYAKSKVEAEQVVLEALAGTQTRASVLRMAMVYGEGDRGNMLRLIGSVKKGRFVAIDGGVAKKSLLYSEDAARAAMVAATNPRANQQVFLIAGPQPYSVREIGGAVAESIGRKLRVFNVPSSLLSAAGGVGDAFRKLGVRTPFSRADVRTLTTDLICDVSKARETLGFEATYSLSEGLQKCIRWYDSVLR